MLFSIISQASRRKRGPWSRLKYRIKFKTFGQWWSINIIEFKFAYIWSHLASSHSLPTFPSKESKEPVRNEKQKMLDAELAVAVFGNERYTELLLLLQENEGETWEWIEEIEKSFSKLFGTFVKMIKFGWNFVENLKFERYNKRTLHKIEELVFDAILGSLGRKQK